MMGDHFFPFFTRVESILVKVIPFSIVRSHTTTQQKQSLGRRIYEEKNQIEIVKERR
jgi:hypothetical protein